MTASFTLPPMDKPSAGVFDGIWGKLGNVLSYVITIPVRYLVSGLDKLALDQIESDPRIPEQVKRQLRETPAFRDRPLLLPFVNIGGFVAGILPLFGAMGNSFYNDAIRTLYSLYRPSELSAAEAAAAVVGGQITPEKGFAYAARAGVPDADFRVMLDTAGTTLAPGQLLDLLNRRDIDVSDVERFLRESSLKDKFIPLLLKLRFNLLGASDYIRFAVRDVFEPAKRAELTLDADYPVILTDKLGRIGYSETDARDSWAAHWELPSPTQVYEMLHRGHLPKDISVEDYLKSADYAPVWRQSLVDISYTPITRTDAKRMYKLRGDFDALVRNFRNNGYNEQDANDLAEFTREDVSLETRQERELLVGPVKTAALAMYKARRISEDQLRQVLANLRYPKETVDRFVADVEFVREADQREDIAAALKAAYVKALRTRDDTVTLLREAGWDGDALDQLLQQWDLLRAVTELQPHQEVTRDLTKGEIVVAYAERVIAPEAAMAQLLALGYDQSETDILLTVADMKRSRAELDAEIENLHLNYLRGAIDGGTASIALDQLGVNVTRRTNLLLRWERERAKVVPDFTVAQLEGMVKSKAMPEDVAQRFLSDQGYTSEQQTYLLGWWLGKRTAEIEKAAALARR
jgi:hypothetical protein